MEEEIKYKTGDFILVPKGTEIYSTINQEYFILSYDVVVKICKLSINNNNALCIKMVRIFDKLFPFNKIDTWNITLNKTTIFNTFDYQMNINFTINDYGRR